MSGTTLGGLNAAETNKLRHGDDFYRRIGAIGGSKKNPDKGFGGNRELARIAGAKGGKISKRTKKEVLDGWEQRTSAEGESKKHRTIWARLLRTDRG